MEKLAIYKATLKLIKEGKVSYLSMAEVGYHARVSASVVETLFENREQLISFAGVQVFESINKVIDAATRMEEPFSKRYFKLWRELITYYTSNPDIVAFLDHFANFPFNVDEVKRLEKQMLTSLIGFFESYAPITQTISAATVANLFHENIKIIARSEGRISETEIDLLAQLFLKAMANSQPASVPALEAA